MENYTELRQALSEARNNPAMENLDKRFSKFILSDKNWDNRKANAVYKMLKKYKDIPRSMLNDIQVEKPEIIKEKFEIKDDKHRQGKIFDILYPGQKEDYSRIEYFNGRALVALPVGAGKTFISLAYAEQHPELKPFIIITPASVKYQWGKVIKEWMPDEKIKMIEGRSDYLCDDDNNIILINYDLLAWYWELLEDLKPGLVIADEAHRLRGSDSKRTQCTKKLARKVPHILFMTGTPIYHRPIDIFPMLKMLGLNQSYYEFGCRFCGEDPNNQFKGASNLKELHKILIDNYMVRRSEQEIKKDLPPENSIVVPMEIDNRKEYDLAEEDFKQYLREYEDLDTRGISGKAETLMKLGRLRTLAAEGKMKMVREWIDDFKESEEKLVLFSYHHRIRDILCENYKGISVRHDGKLTPKAKEKAKSDFIENKDIQFLFGQIHASGEGVDGLQKVCHNLGFVELDWGPKGHDQCIGRIQRNGIDKTIEKINVFWFIALNTIEEKMAEIIDKKRKVIDAAVDGEETDKNNMITELINYYRKK